MSDQRFGNILGRLQNFGSGNPEYLDALFPEPGVPMRIALGPIPHIVRDTIHFDAEPGPGAVEVDHIRANRVLASELDFRLLAKLLPQQNFG